MRVHVSTCGESVRVKSRFGSSNSLKTLVSMPSLVSDTDGVTPTGPSRMRACSGASSAISCANADAGASAAQTATIATQRSTNGMVSASGAGVVAAADDGDRTEGDGSRTEGGEDLAVEDRPGDDVGGAEQRDVHGRRLQVGLGRTEDLLLLAQALDGIGPGREGGHGERAVTAGDGAPDDHAGGVAELDGHAREAAAGIRRRGAGNRSGRRLPRLGEKRQLGQRDDAGQGDGHELLHRDLRAGLVVHTPTSVGATAANPVPLSRTGCLPACCTCCTSVANRTVTARIILHPRHLPVQSINQAARWTATLLVVKRHAA